MLHWEFVFLVLTLAASITAMPTASSSESFFLSPRGRTPEYIRPRPTALDDHMVPQTNITEVSRLTALDDNMVAQTDITEVYRLNRTAEREQLDDVTILTMTSAQLQAALSDRGLSTEGVKVELQARLIRAHPSGTSVGVEEVRAHLSGTSFGVDEDRAHSSGIPFGLSATHQIHADAEATLNLNQSRHPGWFHNPTFGTTPGVRSTSHSGILHESSSRNSAFLRDQDHFLMAQEEFRKFETLIRASLTRVGNGRIALDLLTNALSDSPVPSDASITSWILRNVALFNSNDLRGLLWSSSTSSGVDFVVDATHIRNQETYAIRSMSPDAAPIIRRLSSEVTELLKADGELRSSVRAFVAAMKRIFPTNTVLQFSSDVSTVSELRALWSAFLRHADADSIVSHQEAVQASLTCPSLSHLAGAIDYVLRAQQDIILLGHLHQFFPLYAGAIPSDADIIRRASQEMRFHDAIRSIPDAFALQVSTGTRTNTLVDFLHHLRSYVKQKKKPTPSALFAEDTSLCFICGKSGHRAHICAQREHPPSCQVQACQGNHPTEAHSHITEHPAYPAYVRAQATRKRNSERNAGGGSNNGNGGGNNGISNNNGNGGVNNGNGNNNSVNHDSGNASNNTNNNNNNNNNHNNNNNGGGNSRGGGGNGGRGGRGGRGGHRVRIGQRSLDLPPGMTEAQAYGVFLAAVSRQAQSHPRTSPSNPNPNPNQPQSSTSQSQPSLPQFSSSYEEKYEDDYEYDDEE
jgi:hypothetical protein